MIEAGWFDGVGTFGLKLVRYMRTTICQRFDYKTGEVAANNSNAFQGTLVMGDVECCGSIVAPSPGEVYVAADGFYYVPGASSYLGGGVTQLSELGYHDVDVVELGS